MVVNANENGRDSLSSQHTKTSSNDEPAKALIVEPAKGVSFFTPEQTTPPGTALDGPDGKIPRLFTPLKIRGVQLPNRIWLSPMCQYSSRDGFTTPWHDAHYGGIAQRGPGLSMVEATAVSARGRITPTDAGIWLDDHVDSLKRQVEFAHSQNGLIGIQLAHAGRKASTVQPWLSFGAIATEEAWGWPDDVVSPTDEPFAPEGYPTPRAMSLEEIREVRADFKAGVQRAIRAGFDVIELHFAHGYLLSTFLSPVVNTRTDDYGGSFENRVRLALEIIDDARSVMPESMPLFVRVSLTDWLDAVPEYAGKNWNVDETIRFAHILAEHGVDVLDASSGGVHHKQKIIGGPGYQAAFTKQIKKAVGDKLLVSAVGSITTGIQAQDIISGGKDEDDVPLDLIAVGRSFQKNPGLVWAWADELDTHISVAHQIGWGFAGRGSKKN